MSYSEEQVIPILFMFLLGIIIVNLLINIFLFSFSRIKNIKVLCWYWGSLLITFILQGQMQEGTLPIIISFSFNILPTCIISKILFDSMHIKVPWERYGVLFGLGLVTAVGLNELEQSFTVMALPLCLALGLPLLEAGINALIVKRRTTTVLQKFMGTQYIVGFIHILNFAFFRMVPGNQIWGWGGAITLYQILSISLFAFAFEEYSRGEKARLQELVDERTEKLQNALRIKDTLFKVVLHDIANPVQSQMMMVDMIRNKELQLNIFVEKFTKVTHLIKNIIDQVRSIEMLHDGKMKLDLRPVDLNNCIADAQLIFSERLKEKNIELIVKNDLPQGMKFKADETSFTSSVLSNLISNALKFSPPNSKLNIRAFEKNNRVMVEIEDFGIGMPKEMAFNLFNPGNRSSRPGTNGEAGTGYGLPLVKSYVDIFGGEILVESRSQEEFPNEHGTKITLSLEKSLSSIH